MGKPQPGEFAVLPERHEKFGVALAPRSDLSGVALPPTDVLLDGDIGAPDEFDVYTIDLAAGETWLFSLFGSGANPLGDTVISIYDGDGNFINLDDDGGSGVNSLLTYTAAATGTYFIVVEAFPGSGLTGTYTLDAVLSPGVDTVPDTFAGAVDLAMNTVTYGFIEDAGTGPYGPNFSEVDTYSFTVEAGFLYSIEVAGGADYMSDFFDLPPGELDTVIVVYDQDGNVVIDSDDISFPSDISSRVQFFATEDATYYIDVFSYEPWSGGYSITAQELDPADFDPLDSIIWESANNISLAGGVVQVYFADAGENFGETGDDGVSPLPSFGWNAWEVQAVMFALEEFEKILGVDYVITNDSTEATFRFITTTSTQFGAYMYPADPAFGTQQGIAAFNVDNGGWSFDMQQGLTQGGFDFETILHELGHGHGLAHPHDNGGGSDIMLGVTAPVESYGIFDLNQGVYTVMSYNSSWETGPNGPSPLTAAGVDNGWVGTLSAFDIAALQRRYGVINQYATGNDTYVLRDVQAEGTYYQTIWDTGGKDTISYAGTRDSRIDLLAATIDYSPTGGGVMSFVDGIWGGYTIANGVVIENASGGSGDDSILGNSAKNELKGNAGDDILVGREGADKLDGGTGADTASYLTSGSAVKASLDDGYGKAGDANGDTYKGIEGLQGSNFDDCLEGSKKGDTLSGMDGDDKLNAGDGNDKLDGGGGRDNLDGGKGVDSLAGGDGDDKLYGGKDSDTLNGGAGNDYMSGDAGNDTFVFTASDGVDGICDFKKGQDLLDLSATGISWDELDSNGNDKLDDGDAFVSVSGGDTTIDIGGAAGGVAGLNTVTLDDITNLKEDSFLFG